MTSWKKKYEDLKEINKQLSAEFFKYDFLKMRLAGTETYENRCPNTFEELWNNEVVDFKGRTVMDNFNVYKDRTWIHKHKKVQIFYWYKNRVIITKENFKKHRDNLRIKVLKELNI